MQGSSRGSPCLRRYPGPLRTLRRSQAGVTLTSGPASMFLVRPDKVLEETMPGKISDEIDEIEEIDVAIDDAIANESHDWSQTRTLYVILQGEFCLYRQRNPGSSISDTLHIVAPHIPHHQYKAGPWLSDWRHQTEVPCSPLRLRHAFGDRKQGNEHACRAVPESNLDIITSLGIEAPNPEDARVHITARMPLAILPGV